MSAITLLIIIATIIASIYAWRDEDIYRKWIMNPYLANRKNEYFRFLTSGFIHADQVHLFINMLTLYFFGPPLEGFLESIFGPVGLLYFLAIYVSAIVISEIPTYFKHRNDYNYNSLGASGAVSAIVFAFIVINPLADIYFFFLIKLPAFVFGLLYLGYSYYSSRRSMDNINHDAHFYGAVYGIIIILLIEPSLIQSFANQMHNLF